MAEMAAATPGTPTGDSPSSRCAYLGEAKDDVMPAKADIQ